MADTDDREQVWKDFGEAVNMTPAELEKWLKTDESREVGTGVGHDFGEHILDIRHKKKAELTDEDYAHMHKVVGYVHRHMAQHGPADDKEHSPWRYSLMNWGHDPLKR
ncbi:DUF3140 domain-containing protein [Sphingomonas sp. KR1UV-12]|uniref:DUF3140 domain-containing protein n=1 Tax=Sphingomonas aurea TaxID=3063994 RepID=A0ABT9ENY5_9SPHN|nr:DUF3140 domain-containing protein [Sphingomonas sp. KR1UV-12]MDP1028516.1 DUF3140 domain-containing protein [Sphingomonas sp. KR1UV-12]